MEKPVKLDLIDQKILVVLLQNGRISLTELAKLIKQNYPTVRNRVNKLIENGVIKNFYPVIQYRGIGARYSMSIYLKIKNITTEEKKDILKKLCKYPLFIEVFELEGRWNISILLVGNYIKEAHLAIEHIQDLCGDYLSDLIVMRTATVHNINRPYFSDKKINIKNSKTGYYNLFLKKPFRHIMGPSSLNQKDIQMIDYIKLNGRAGLDELSKSLKVHSTLIDYKFKKFISDRLIKKFTIDLDSSKLGYEEYLLFLNFRGNKDKKEELIQEMSLIKEPHHYFEYLNYWELVITFCVKDRSELYELFSEIQDKYKECIKDHEILFLAKKWKKEPYPDAKEIYGIYDPSKPSKKHPYKNLPSYRVIS